MRILKTITFAGMMLLPLGCSSVRSGVSSFYPEPIMVWPRQSVKPLPPVARHQAPKPVPRAQQPIYAGLPVEVLPPGGINTRWTYIVVHHSATDSGGARRFHQVHVNNNGWNELGYHFVIGNGTDTPDGSIEVGPRWIKQKHGAHCKTPDNAYNEHGIGICLVGNFEHDYPSAAQMRSLQNLVRFLSKACRIPPERITTHGEVTHKTACPGRNFSLHALKNGL